MHDKPIQRYVVYVFTRTRYQPYIGTEYFDGVFFPAVFFFSMRHRSEEFSKPASRSLIFPSSSYQGMYEWNTWYLYLLIASVVCYYIIKVSEVLLRT